MTTPIPDPSLPEGARCALYALSGLDEWLQEVRSAAAVERLLSRASRRRIESTLREIEEFLEEVRSALFYLVSDVGPVPYILRDSAVDRATEALSCWRLALEQAKEHRANLEEHFFSFFGPRFFDGLELIVEALNADRALEAADQKRHDEAVRLLAQPNLPMM